MALSLQDLLVGKDAGAAQAPRGNALPSRSTAGNTQDPFAALFASKGDPKPAPLTRRDDDANAEIPKDRPQRQTRSAAPEQHTRARVHAHAQPTTSDNAKAAGDDRRSDAKRADDTATPKSDAVKDKRADDAAPADDASGADITTADAQAKDDATVAPAIINVFQVALLASDQTTAVTNTDPQSAAVTATAAAATVPTPNAPTAPTAAVVPAVADDAAKTVAATSTEGIAAAADAIAATQTVQTSAPTKDPSPSVEVAVPQPAADATATATAATTAPQTPAAPAQDGTQRPAPQAAAVAQAVVQATLAAAPQQPTAIAQIAVQAARPAEPSGKAAAIAHADQTAKATRDTAKQQPDAPSAPAQDGSAPEPTLAPPAPSVAGDSQVVGTAAAPVVDTDAPAPALAAPATATPIAAPIANPQAHQVYAQANARTAALPQFTVDHVVAHVAKAADDGFDQFTIQLKPEHLGAIEVKLEMHDDGGIAKATISADRADTLDLLQRDSHRLERALENAGVKADAGSLSFNLRGDGGRQQPAFTHGGTTPQLRPSIELDDTANLALTSYFSARAALGGVDIRV